MISFSPLHAGQECNDQIVPCDVWKGESVVARVARVGDIVDVMKIAVGSVRPAHVAASNEAPNLACYNPSPDQSAVPVKPMPERSWERTVLARDGDPVMKVRDWGLEERGCGQFDPVLQCVSETEGSEERGSLHRSRSWGIGSWQGHRGAPGADVEAQRASVSKRGSGCGREPEKESG